jgi:hypothetical protein
MLSSYLLDILPNLVPVVLKMLPLLSIRATRVPVGVNTLPSLIRYWVVPRASRMYWVLEDLPECVLPPDAQPVRAMINESITICM